MNEPEPGGVQRLTAETQGFQNRLVTLLCSTVNRIAEQGVTERGHVHAHLMRSPGFQATLDQSAPSRSRSSVE